MPSRTNNTLVYAPEIQVLVATTEGTLDISEDVVSFQLRRTVNSASQFSCVLNNRNQKYTGRLGRMDRIVVFLKRFEKLQCFSGYLDSVPGLALYTNICEIRATCTLKRLLNTWWDPGLPASQELLLNQEIWDNVSGGDTLNRDTDSGLGMMMGNVLIEVAGWKKEDIYIQNIPAGLTELVDDVEENQEQLTILKKLLGIGPSAATQTAGGTPISSTGGPVIALQPGQYEENFDGDGFDAKFVGPFPEGDAVERWRPLAMLALQTLSVDPTIIDLMMHRIRVESTGNPNAINLYDSNAQKGTPSKGILQCIDSTFRAHAVSPYNGHIYSPFGSMLASIQYVKSRYKGDFQKAYSGTAGY
jgi:hypothetical protein